MVIEEETDVNQEVNPVAGNPADNTNLITNGNRTRKVQWSEEMKTVLVECLERACEGEKVGYIKRMKAIWDDLMFETRLSTAMNGEISQDAVFP